MDMITIPRAEYDRLVAAAEELADIAAYDRAIAAGGESLPHDVLKRILEGESPVRAIREWRGITSAELARRAGVNRVQVHEIETGKKRGSAQTLKRLADALDVPLDDLVAG
jgi:mRNA interferase RelE/StbE